MAAMSTRKFLTLNSLYSSPLKQSLLFLSSLNYSTKSSAFGARKKNTATEKLSDIDDSAENDSVPTSGISRPLSEILKELNKKVPDSLVSQRVDNGFSLKYVPWHIVNRIMNLHAPEWSGEVRNITYSPDGKSVSVVYRVTLYGTDAELCLNRTLMPKPEGVVVKAYKAIKLRAGRYAFLSRLVDAFYLVYFITFA